MVGKKHNNKNKFLLVFAMFFLMANFYGQTKINFASIDSVIDGYQTQRYSWCAKEFERLKNENRSNPKILQVVFAKSSWFMASRKYNHLAELEMSRALAICNSENCYPERGIVNLINAEFYFKKNKIVKALEIVLQNNLELEKWSPNSKVLSDSYLQTVKYYNNLDCFAEAQAFLKKNIQHSKKNKFNVNLSKIYSQYGRLLRRQKKGELALKYFRKSIKNDNLNKSFSMQASTYNDMASVYIDLKDYDSAFFFLNKAKEYSAKGYVLNTDLLSLDRIVNKRIALVFEGKGMIDSALYYGKKSLKDYSGNDYFLNDQESLYRILSDCYERKKLLDSALYYKKLELSEFKSIQFLEKNNFVDMATQRAKIKFQDDAIRLLHENDKLEKRVFQKERIIVMAAILLIGLILYGFYRKKILRQVQVSLQLEQKVLRSQMNPHFIFNALVAIQNSMMNADVMESASHVAKFAKLIRQNFDFTQKDYITLAEDLDALKNYISIQKMRFGKKFEYHIDHSGIEIDKILIPPMLLQPFVENAIEHGFKGIKESGFLKIGIYSISQNRICFRIEDNGVGFKPANDNKLHSTEIFKARISMHSNQDLKSFTIMSRPEFQGTKIEFKYTIKNASSYN